MRILYLVHRIPYPPDKGDKIRSFRWLEALSREHEIDLVTFCDDPADMAHEGVLREMCATVQIFPLNPKAKRVASVLRLPNGRPMSLTYFDHRGAREAVKALCLERSPDVALCFSAPMAEYVRGTGLPTVMDMVDVDSAKFDAYGESAAPVMRQLYGLEGRRLARYEELLVEELDAVVLCTDQECDSLRERSRGRIESITNGAAPPADDVIPERRDSKDIVFIGAMDYLANVDAVEFAARDIMPLILEREPTARFRIVGRDPAPAVRALDRLAGVEVAGAQPDLVPFLESSAVSLLSFRIARGIQNKALEAMGWRIPVVTAAKIATSMGADPGRHLLTAATPEEYAEAVCTLLSDEARRDAVGRAGREFVLEHFDWARSVERLERLLEEVAGARVR